MSNFEYGLSVDSEKYLTPSSAANFYSNLSLEEQKELFLLKYNDVSRDDVSVMLKDFIRCDIGRKGHLDEYEAMILMEDREIVITAPELREMIQSADLTCSHKLIFIEWCCAYFKKSYKGLPQS